MSGAPPVSLSLVAYLPRGARDFAAPLPSTQPGTTRAARVHSLARPARGRGALVRARSPGAGRRSGIQLPRYPGDGLPRAVTTPCHDYATCASDALAHGLGYHTPRSSCGFVALRARAHRDSAGMVI